MYHIQIKILHLLSMHFPGIADSLGSIPKKSEFQDAKVRLKTGNNLGNTGNKSLKFIENRDGHKRHGK